MSTLQCVTIVNLHSNKVGRFWQIARRLHDVHFLAVRGGYGFQRVPRRVPRNVEIIDHVDADSMGPLVWARTRVLLAPSARESWGMTATEALQRGIPVIAAPTPGLLESLGDAGIFIDRRRTRLWARQVRALLSDHILYLRQSSAAYRRGGELLRQSDQQTAQFCDAIERLGGHA